MLTQERKKKLVNNVFIKGQLSRKYPLVVFHKVEYDVVLINKPYSVIKELQLTIYCKQTDYKTEISLNNGSKRIQCKL